MPNDEMTQEQTMARYQCSAMLAAVALANQYTDKMVEWLNKNTRYRYWEYTHTGTCSSLYHDWGACIHLQYVVQTGGGYANEFHLLKVYVHMDEDKVTYSHECPGYQSRSHHVTYNDYTYETLNDLNKLFRHVPWNTQTGV